jgi:hypothetical protein
VAGHQKPACGGRLVRLGRGGGLVLAAACLTACGTLAPDFSAYVVGVKDQAALTADRTECARLAAGYPNPFSPAKIAVLGVKGGLSQAPAAAIPPHIAPALGALGAAGSALLDQLGVISTSQRGVFLTCLRHRSERSGAYEVLEPN